MMRTAVKLAVAAALFALIAHRVDFSTAIGILAGVDALIMAAVVGLSFGIVFADAAFWSRSMRAVGLRMRFRPAFLFSMVGWFFANLAPSSVGADLFRAAQMRFAGAGVGQSARLVVSARLMSFASLLVVIGAGLPFSFQYVTDRSDQIALIAVFAASVIGFMGFVSFGPLLSRLPSPLRKFRPDIVADLAVDTKTLLMQGDVAQWAYLTAQHLLRIAGVAGVALALNAPIDFAALFALIPVALLVAMIPISFGGWGVREASFVYFLGLAGLGEAAALAISIAYGLTRVFIGAIGGLAWMAARRDHYNFAIDQIAENDQLAAQPGARGAK